MSTNTTTGRCLCGQITVAIPTDALNPNGRTAVCHCKNCCRSGGSLGSINVFVPEADVQIKGQPKVYEDKDTNSGATVRRGFCANCGSPIYSATPNAPGMQVIKLSLFDNIPKPTMELYCKSIPAWNKPIDGTKQFDAMPPQ